MLQMIAKTGFAALVLAVGMTISAAPSSAGVSQAQRDACEKKAGQVRPALRAGEREAFIANCLADATVEKPKR